MTGEGEGWRSGKFVVKHWRRGDLLDGEAFVLVPARDPAAVEAMLAYIRATPDATLAADLRTWLLELGQDELDTAHNGGVQAAVDRIPGWIRLITVEVHAGRMDLETALSRIAGHAIDATRRELGKPGLPPV